MRYQGLWHDGHHHNKKNNFIKRMFCIRTMLKFQCQVVVSRNYTVQNHTYKLYNLFLTNFTFYYLKFYSFFIKNLTNIQMRKYRQLIILHKCDLYLHKPPFFVRKLLGVLAICSTYSNGNTKDISRDEFHKATILRFYNYNSTTLRFYDYDSTILRLYA